VEISQSSASATTEKVIVSRYRSIELKQWFFKKMNGNGG